MRIKMQVMSGAGDQTITWDPEDEASMVRAEAKIEALREEGYSFFVDGERFDDITKMVRTPINSVVAVPRMAGG